MPQAALLQHVPHAPDDVLKLVADVESYPNFIELISALRITKSTNIDEMRSIFEADAIVRYKFISETFGSKIEVDKAKRAITVTKASKGGAVKSLRNDWIFHALSDGSTLVDFDVDVRLKAFPLEILAREKFPKVAERIMGYFIDHAAKILPVVSSPELNISKEISNLGLSAARLL